MRTIITRPNPQGQFAELHPWAALTGHPCGVAVCSHCGAGLVRSVVIAADGAVWGRDCYASAHPAEAHLVRRRRRTTDEEALRERRVAKVLAKVARMEARYPGAHKAALDDNTGFEPRRAARTVRRWLASI